MFLAKAVVLATGGIGRAYRITSNSWEGTGDGHALAYHAAYEFGGHIPGAVHSTWHEYSDPNAVPKGLLNTDLGQIERLLRRLGMNQDSDVVIYSNPFDNWGDEGRMFWMLEYLGHKRLRILDGGWVKWTDEKRPFEHGPVSPADVA